MSLADKKALITGACSGIGYAIGEEFLRNDAKVLIVVDIHLTEPESIASWRAKYPKASVKYFSVDVRLDEKLKKCYEDVEKAFGSLDIVVNCAGIMGEHDYKRMIDINFAGMIGSSLYAIENMRKDGKGSGGVIVNFASIVGVEPVSVCPVYSATKVGINAFHRSVAHDNDQLGIKFLSICPGLTETSLFDNKTHPGFHYLATAEKLQKTRAAMKSQKPDVISTGLIKLIHEAKNGSVWVIEEGKWREEIFPELKY
ncbi:alcohol dehydrogenase 1-like [Phlebotomus argentipes]|uniref:alcohol dehydrogenase 1-like n=1 Tax=Phlebotomus argentipes TaxID=94469 RepID=UPI0028937D97|nr:alcohol dehydrogenase 1-like [Phlebotomus argentipes]